MRIFTNSKKIASKLVNKYTIIENVETKSIPDRESQEQKKIEEETIQTILGTFICLSRSTLVQVAYLGVFHGEEALQVFKEVWVDADQGFDDGHGR